LKKKGAKDRNSRWPFFWFFSKSPLLFALYLLSFTMSNSAYVPNPFSSPNTQSQQNHETEMSEIRSIIPSLTSIIDALSDTIAPVVNLTINGMLQDAKAKLAQLDGAFKTLTVSYYRLFLSNVGFQEPPIQTPFVSAGDTTPIRSKKIDYSLNDLNLGQETSTPTNLKLSSPNAFAFLETPHSVGAAPSSSSAYRSYSGILTFNISI
jgi:hypothetical protein